MVQATEIDPANVWTSAFSGGVQKLQNPPDHLQFNLTIDSQCQFPLFDKRGFITSGYFLRSWKYCKQQKKSKQTNGTVARRSMLDCRLFSAVSVGRIGRKLLQVAKTLEIVSNLPRQ